MRKCYLSFALISLWNGASLFSQEIDTTFGEQGNLPFYYSSAPQSSYVGTNTNSNGNNGTGNASVIQPDGKIVTVLKPNRNDSDLHMYIYRFMPDGSPDYSFGDDGAAKLFSGSNSVGHDVILQADGKIVIVGETEYCVNGVCGALQFIMLRVSPDGTLDTSFGVNGHLTTSHVYGASGTYAIPKRVHLLENGKMVVGGRGPSGRPSIVRLNTNGMPDNTFGTNGVYVLSHVPRTTFVDMQVNEQGETFALYRRDTYNADEGGFNRDNHSDFGIFKVSYDGSLETSFGTNGLSEMDIEVTEIPTSLLLTSTNKLLVAGYNLSRHEWFSAGRESGNGTLERGFVAQFNTTGEVDPSVINGFKSFHFPADSATYIQKIVELTSEEYLLCGYTIETPDYLIFKRKGLLFSLTNDLELNTNFNQTGHMIFNHGIPSTSIGAPTIANLYDIDVTADNKILVTGGRNPTNALSRSGIFMLRLNYLSSNGDLGIENIQDESSFDVFPNPIVDQIVNLTTVEEGHVQIIALDGKVFYEKDIEKGTNTFQIETTFKGMAILKITFHNGQELSKKLVVQ